MREPNSEDRYLKSVRLAYDFYAEGKLVYLLYNKLCFASGEKMDGRRGGKGKKGEQRHQLFCLDQQPQYRGLVRTAIPAHPSPPAEGLSAWSPAVCFLANLDDLDAHSSSRVTVVNIQTPNTNAQRSWDSTEGDLMLEGRLM